MPLTGGMIGNQADTVGAVHKSRGLIMKYRFTREFEHYQGCRHRDPDNCSGCALTDERQASPNYSAWPLAYMENQRAIPAKWRKAFERELRSDNQLYADNVRQHIREYGVRFVGGERITDPSVFEAVSC